MRSRVVFLRTPTPILMSRTATTSAMTESRTYSPVRTATTRPRTTPTEDTTSENKCLASPSSAIDRLLLASFIIAQARIPLRDVALMDTIRPRSMFSSGIGSDRRPRAASMIRMAAIIMRMPSTRADMFSAFWCPYLWPLSSGWLASMRA